MTEYLLEVNPEGLAGINTMFVYNWSDPGVQILLKRREIEKGDADFEIGIKAALLTFIAGWRKFYAEPVCLYIVF